MLLFVRSHSLTWFFFLSPLYSAGFQISNANSLLALGGAIFVGAGALLL